MKTNEELKSENRIQIIETAGDGGIGTVSIGKWSGSVIWSTGAGWEHVSVSPWKKFVTPSWDDMCRLKHIFFNDDEVVVEYHPAEDSYVNNMPNCLHLWRPTKEALPIPPAILVGVPKGMSRTEIAEEVKRIDEVMKNDN